MSSLAETIDTALAAVGRETEDQLRDVSADFEALKLADEERVSALATAIATIAVQYHKRHVSAYLEAVRTWSIEIAELLQPPRTELRYIPDTATIEAAAERLAPLVAGALPPLPRPPPAARPPLSFLSAGCFGFFSLLFL